MLCMLMTPMTKKPSQKIILIKFCLVLKIGLQKVALFGTLRELKLYKEVETQTYVWLKNPYHYKIIKC